MSTTYSIPAEATKLLTTGIILNALHKSAPAELFDAAKHITFTGSALPSIPINWRFAESISALKGFQGAMLSVLLSRKHGLERKKYPEISINTDHAQLFIMSLLLTTTIDPLTGTPLPVTSYDPAIVKRFAEFFPECDFHDAQGDWHRRAATNIYRTQDGRYYHIHGSLNPEPTQDALGIPHYITPAPESLKEATGLYAEKLSALSAEEVDVLMNETWRQAGTIAMSAEEFRESEHGRANAHVGLFEVHHVPNPLQTPAWWSTPAAGDPKRPLAGLKVVELARIIAAPAVTRELAELGASVMRITAPHLADINLLHPDLNWGKWTAELDLRRPEDREKLRELIAEADVVLDGYRPGVMEKWGFGKEQILGMSEKGLVFARENCYGWNGPWAERSGWQQISDACCGVSLAFGRAMGNDEPVTPVFPNSDYCTGVAGATGILQALIERAEKGGSFVVDIALNYYSQWLVNSCGEYPDEVWQEVWQRNGRQVMQHDDNMLVLLPAYMKMLQGTAAGTLFSPEFFEIRESKAIGAKLRCVKPVLGFPGGEVELGYNVGTRGNGVDKPHWPEDLTVEVVV